VGAVDAVDDVDIFAGVVVDVDVDVDVGAVVVVDDTPEYMDKLMPVIAYEGDCAPRLELQVVAIP